MDVKVTQQLSMFECGIYVLVNCRLAMITLLKENTDKTDIVQELSVFESHLLKEADTYKMTTSQNMFQIHKNMEEYKCNQEEGNGMLYQSFTDNPIGKVIISIPTSTTFESLFIPEKDLDNRNENYKSKIKSSSKLFNYNRDQKTRIQKLSENRCHLNKNKINTGIVVWKINHKF